MPAHSTVSIKNIDEVIHLESISSIATKQLTRDRYGFAKVWLPIGTPGTIRAESGDYEVTLDDLMDKVSNESLAGIDVVIRHPDGSLVTPGNYRDLTVGVVLGETRYNSSTNTVEVLSKIKDADTILMVESGELTETSTGYSLATSSRQRLYNHIAIVPTGYARGGRNMVIKTESLYIEKKMETQFPTVLEIKKAVLEGFDTLDASEAAIETIKTEAYESGYKAGLASVQVEANKAIITSAFPNLVVESLTDDQVNILVEAAAGIQVKKETQEIPSLTHRNEAVQDSEVSTIRKRPARRTV